MQPQYSSGPQMHRPSRFAHAPACKWILIILVLGYLIDVINAQGLSPYGRRILPFSALILENGLLSGEVWRLILYPITDLGFGSIIFNGFTIFGFGTMVESYIGTQRFVKMVISAILSVAAVFVLLTLIGNGANSYGLMGANGIAFAVIAAAAFYAPNMEARLLIPPVTLKLSTIAAIIIGLGIVMMVSTKSDWTAALANLSATGIGWWFIKKSRPKGKKKRRRSKKADAKYEAKLKPRTTIDLKAEKAIDKILDKVNTEGIGNLSDKERKLLLKASKKND